MNKLFGRSLLAFLVLPGTVALLVPLVVIEVTRRSFTGWPGLVVGCVGTVLLLWCVREFYVSGKGTLAPWAPPAQLVVTGPYRYSRNPMYVAVVLILLGWTLSFRSSLLVVYTLGVAIAFRWRVVAGEEPRLARRHGKQWTRYKETVPRWLRIGPHRKRQKTGRLP